jgi:hypothetical protein
MNSYQAAFMNLDPDGPQYISSNTGDEQSHAGFLNAYLPSLGAEPVNLDEFRTLPSSQATGAKQIGRLTNLTKLSVDTSWYIRYRSTTNPDFGATFPQALPALFEGQFTAIPRNNADFTSPNHIQVIANTAAFHFGVHRARRLEPLCFTQPEGNEHRSAADYPRDRRRRDLPFPGMARFLGQ